MTEDEVEVSVSGYKIAVAKADGSWLTFPSL